MRIKTTAGWIFAGFGLLMLGQFLSMFGLAEDDKVAAFLFMVGLVYFGIGFVGRLVRDLHMDRRTRAQKQ